MRRKISFVAVLLAACSLVFTGCEGKDAEQSQTVQAQSVDKNESTEADTKEKESNVDTDKEAETSQSSEVKEEKTVLLYGPDENAEGFTTEEVKTDSLSPEWLISQLIERKIVPSSVKVLSFKETENEGKKAVDLDLSKDFGEYIQSLGTTGEYLVIGSVCNTFLKAYDSEQIRITVDGQTLESGHATYEKYLSEYK